MSDSTTDRPEPLDVAELRRQIIENATGWEEAYQAVAAEMQWLRDEAQLCETLRTQLAVAHDVIRRLRDGWRPGKNMAVVMAGSPRPDPVPVWMHPSIRRSEPMTDAERMLLDAVAGPNDPPGEKPWPGEVFPDRGRWAFRCGIDGCEMNGTGYATRDDAERRLRTHGATETCPYTYERGPNDTEENRP